MGLRVLVLTAGVFRGEAGLRWNGGDWAGAGAGWAAQAFGMGPGIRKRARPQRGASWPEAAGPEKQGAGTRPGSLG